MKMNPLEAIQTLEQVARHCDFRASEYAKARGGGILSLREDSKAQACRDAIKVLREYLPKCDYCHGLGSYHMVINGTKKRVFCDHGQGDK